MSVSVLSVKQYSTSVVSVGTLKCFIFLNSKCTKMCLVVRLCLDPLGKIIIAYYNYNYLPQREIIIAYRAGSG